MATRTLVAALLVALITAGCTFPPGLTLRDDYMGKRFVEQKLLQRRVTHDELGNPIVDGQTLTPAPAAAPEEPARAP